MKKKWWLLFILLGSMKVNAISKWDAINPNNLVMDEKIEEHIDCQQGVCTVTYTIPSDYNLDVVNIVPTAWQGENEIGMPGDTYELKIKIINNSKYNYNYVDKSFYIKPYSDPNKSDVLGFTGELIPIGSTMYRISTSEPLIKLFNVKKLNTEQLSDASIEAKLANLGYKNGIQDLDKYYLDYFNKKYQQNFKAIEDLPTQFINKIWPDISEYPTVLETNHNLIAFNYNYFYNVLFTMEYGDKIDLDNSKYSIGYYLNNFNDSGSYDKLNDNFNALSLKTNEETDLEDMYFHLNGPLTKNSYVLFKYGMDMGFSLKREEKEAEVIAYYLDSFGNYLNEPVIMKKNWGEEYLTEEKSFDKYHLIRIDGLSKGIINQDKIEVYYMYDLEKQENENQDTDLDVVNTGVNEENYLGWELLILGGLLVFRKLV